MHSQYHNFLGPTQSFPFTKLESYSIGSTLNSRKVHVYNDTYHDEFQDFLSSGALARNPSQ